LIIRPGWEAICSTVYEENYPYVELPKKAINNASIFTRTTFVLLIRLPNRNGEKDDDDTDKNHGDQYSTYHVNAVHRRICNIQAQIWLLHSSAIMLIELTALIRARARAKKEVARVQNRFFRKVVINFKISCFSEFYLLIFFLRFAEITLARDF
jgi:hypothetical protein